VGAAAVAAFAVAKLTPKAVSGVKNAASSFASNFDAQKSSVYQANNLTPYNSASTLAPSASSRGGVTINFNGLVGDPVLVAQRVKEVLSRLDRRTGGM
jgi:hypothetical protein